MGAIGLGKAELTKWLRETCSSYVLEPVAVFRHGGHGSFPLVAETAAELEHKLDAGGHLMPLPREPAALANIVEVSLVDFLLGRLREQQGASGRRGTERGYPDIEISGDRFGGGFHALDVKVARRSTSGRQTQSRITLYTGNTYFRYPRLHWPGTFRPFEDYASHLVLIAIYTLSEDSLSHIEDLELIIQESWQIGSRQRSSTTREYIGAVTSLESLRAGHGDFEMETDFYAYWRKYPFTIGRAVQQQLDRILAEGSEDG